MTLNHHQTRHSSNRQFAGIRISALIGSFLCSVMAIGVASAGETDAANHGDLDRDVTREVTQNEDGSTTFSKTGTVTDPETGATATFDSSRTVIETETGQEWTSEGTRTNFEGETLMSSGSGSVVKGEDTVSKTRTQTVTNETTGDVQTRTSDIVVTRTDEGVAVVGVRSHTGPDGETVTHEIDRVRPPRPDGIASDRPVRPHRPDARPVRLARPDRPIRPDRPARVARHERPVITP